MFITVRSARLLVAIITIVIISAVASSASAGTGLPIIEAILGHLGMAAPSQAGTPERMTAPEPYAQIGVGTMFCSTDGPVTIADAGPSAPYPSIVTVSGLTGTITTINVHLNSIQHTYMTDMDILLVSPTGQKFVVLSDAGSNVGLISPKDLVFSDSGVVLPTSGLLLPGTYLPRDTDSGDAFAAPAPFGPYARPDTVGSATLNGTFGSFDPNGNWSLYIVDDEDGDAGSMASWCLDIQTGAAATPTATPTVVPTATPTPTPSCPVNVIADGGFETGGIPNSFWDPETSTNYSTPLCSVLCGTGGGLSAPRTGLYWAWFGGVSAAENATLGQTVTIPSGTADLNFWMRIGRVTSPFTDVLNVRVDGVLLQSYPEPAVAEGGYTLRTINVNAFADGGSHLILFEYIGPTAGHASFVVDDVSLDSACPAGTPTATPTPTATASATATPTATPTAAPTATPVVNVIVAGSTGADGGYPTLGAAFAALNANSSQSGKVITVTIVGDTNEGSVAAVLNQPSSSSWASLTIKPSGGARTVTGDAGTDFGLIHLNGVDDVTIDGSLSGSTDRSLSITVANRAAAVIWMTSASVSNGANRNTVRNCYISGSGDSALAGFFTGNGMIFGADAETSNSDNTFQNNSVFRVQNAVFIRGNAIALDRNWMVAGNSIGSVAPLDKLTFRGIIIANAQDFTIADNTIGGISSTPSSSSTVSGIQVTLVITRGMITGNRISDVKQTNTTGWGSNGIYLDSASPFADVTVANNFIDDIASQGYTEPRDTDNGYGLVVTNGGGYKIHHNTILMNTNQGAGAANGVTAAVNIVTGDPDIVDLHDNILANTQTLGTRYAIISTPPTFIFDHINNNDYFAPIVGIAQNTVRPTLADWQAATGEDAASISADPMFVANSGPADLHLKSTSPAINAGAPVGITLDIDGETRDATPDIGADEFIPISVCDTVFTRELTSSKGVDMPIPVNITDVTGSALISIDFTFTYDPTVLAPVFRGPPFPATEVSTGPGTVAPSATIIANQLAPGVIKVVMFGAAPFSGSGPLVYINMHVIGATGTNTALTLSDALYNGGTVCSSTAAGSLEIVIAPTTTTVTSSMNPSVYGSSVTFTANVGSTPPVGNNGTVTFIIDGSPVCLSVPLAAGTATCATATLDVPMSPHSVLAYYNGTADFAASPGLLAGRQTVTAAASLTSIICPPSVVYDGTNRTPCVAAVTGAGGLMTTATVNYTANRNVGTVTATASYAGDPNHTGSSAAPVMFIITPRALTISPVTNTKIYDGTTSSSQVPNAAPIQSGDSVTGRVQVFVSPNVMGLNGSTLRVSAYTVNDGNGGNNYTVNSSATIPGTILRAGAICTVTPYNVMYDGMPHTAAGQCLGVLGETLTGLDLTGTTHTEIGDYTDPWTFTDVTGNYSNSSGGTVHDVIFSGTITGSISYALAATPAPVPDAALNAPGSIPVSDVTDAAGSYSLGGFGSGPYTVTPSKTTQLCGTSNGINSNDAGLVSQHVVGLITLSGTQLLAAKVSGPSTPSISSFDAALIAQKVVGICDPISEAGRWRFTPASVAHPGGITANSVENYTAYMMGDISGDWNPTGPARPAADAPTANAVIASAPVMTAAPGKVVTVPVRIDNLQGKSIGSYQFDILFDPKVLSPLQAAASVAGTMGEALTVVSNSPEPGLLKVAVYGAIPVNGDGVYAELRFTVTGGIGSSTPLAIEGFRFNDGTDEAAAAAGSVTVSDAANTAVLTGRLLSPTGSGANGIVTLASTDGSRQQVSTDQFGRFQFGGLAPGGSYEVAALSKRYKFRSVTVNIVTAVTDVDLIAGE